MRNTVRLIGAVALAFTLKAPAQTTATPAAPPPALPPWSDGVLEIHQISTGRGNSAFAILPDGTTLLIDAGAAGDGMVVEGAEPRPDASQTAGSWIARYIERRMAPKPAHLDYALLTHYHADHIGQVTKSSVPSKSGAYKLSGITEVGDRIPIDVLIDRGDDYLVPAQDPTYRNYRAFAAEQQKTRSMRVESLHVGRNDQIVLRHDPSRYPTFEVRNVAANGVIWTGHGDETRTTFPPLKDLATEDIPSENMCSLGIRIRYGKFSYFTGGDMPGIPDAGNPEWQSVERAVAEAIGPTSVHVADHHGSIDPESPFFLATLRSRVMILPAWSATHPSQDALKRMMTQRLYPGPHDIFVTTLREPTKLSIGSRVSQLKADHGHIVVRVEPGGDQYRVWVLDDTTAEAKVLATFGPYPSE